MPSWARRTQCTALTLCKQHEDNQGHSTAGADDKRDELDAIVARTSAFINLMATIPPTSDSHTAAKALTQETPPSSAPGSAAAAAAKGGPREALVTMCTAAVARAQSMAAGVSLASHESAWEGLCRLRAEGLKLLAEFTALSVQHAAFLAMCLEGGDAEAARLDFSPGAMPECLFTGYPLVAT